MNAFVTAARPPRRSPASPYTRLRATHPVRVLRWLRTGVLIGVVATALLYLLVATEARREISAARRTSVAVGDIGNAVDMALIAGPALDSAFAHEDVPLTGAGTTFTGAMAQVGTDITSAAQGNAAGVPGATQIQFVQDQLATCNQLAAAAVLDFSTSRAEADTDALKALNDPDETDPDTHAAIANTGGLLAALRDLEGLEQGGLNRQRASHWLDPGSFWWLLTGPVIVTALLALASAWVVASHFRRIVSPLLAAALLVAATVAVTAGALSTHDESRLSANPLASHPVTLAAAPSLLCAAGVLAYLAYRPRLNEYRFQR
ncbi:hypothetical protein GA0115240_109418 [Streptomyces sp. DvalAA-14]|uniref:hypothetical protein n=1 Tax=unclassified Streptomyces TaxID=2593676 RepID=UPI00081B16C6|nr:MULTISPECIES: hypothetical protein [unclassified Streptomyces]MYS19509.1 hypothetical protein [Streptomyces sp. SID4948]SCD46089.1 hypothetical protein GA0115240_109418 [Streptomyces sp. DvalAA-14]